MGLPLLALSVSLAGVWDASIQADGYTVPFRLQVAQKGAQVAVSVLDGNERITSTSGSFRDGQLRARWDYYDATLEAAFEAGQLRGTYGRQTRRGPVKMPFQARPFAPVKLPEQSVSKFDGAWVLKADVQTGASVWTASFRQSGAELTGTIQRVDGDFGTLAGQVRGNKATLSHFDCIRLFLVEMELKPDGTLVGRLNNKDSFTGVRAAEAETKGIPRPPDPSRYTSVKNPAAPFPFRAPDLDGRMVSAEDFRGKVLIVTIMGSWCPNCHDEAPFLEELYRKYKQRGLAVVALAFEYTGDVERDREQVRAFNRRHGITYPTLLAGTTNDGEIQRVLPELANFGAYPTSIYIGRDGLVREVHAGFSGPATGADFKKLKRELEDLVVRELSER